MNRNVTYDYGNVIKSHVHFDSKFSKNFRRQIRIYIRAIFKMYTKKFEKPLELNQLEKDFFWLLTTYFINRKIGVSMNTQDIKSQYFRKHSSQQKRGPAKINKHKRLVKKIMK